MQLVIFLVEVIVILFYLNSEDKITDYKYIIPIPHEDYSAYYSIDVVDNQILTLSSVEEEKKIKIWRASPLQQEVLDYFPKIEEMREVYNDRVVDNGLFKAKFESYMLELYDCYIGGEISSDEFKKMFLNPPDNLPDTY